jgi:MFS family permease
LVLFFGVLMAALDLAIVGPVLRPVRESFGLSPRIGAWVLNTFVLFNLVGVPIMSRLADRIGRRRVYTTAVLAFGAGAVVVATAPSFEILLVGRAIQGAAASGIFPAASAMIGDTFPVEKRGRALGVLGAVYGIAFLVGPGLAGAFLANASWNGLYLLNVPLALGVAFAAWRVLPSTTTASEEGIDIGGILTLGVALTALAVGINQIDAANLIDSLLSPRAGGLLAVAAGMMVGFIAVERRVASPLLRLGLFQHRPVGIAAVLAVGAGLAEASFIFFPEFAVESFDVPSSTASFMLLPLVGAVAIGSPVAGRLLDRVGVRRIVIVSSVLFTAGLAVISAVPGDRVAFYTGSVLLGGGLAGLLGSSLSYILLNAARETERTVAQGIITLFLGVGQLVGGALIGAIAVTAADTPGDAGPEGYATAFALVAGVGLLCTVLGFLLPEKTEATA